MTLKCMRFIAPTSFTGARESVTPAHRVIICLLLTTLLSVSCARPSATAGNHSSPHVYVAVGDSTGIGLGARDGGGYVDRLFARIDQKRPGYTLVNLSAAGATTADVINKQIPRLDGTRATLVTICVGVNDLLRGREAKQFAEDYETLVAMLRQSAGSILITNLPDVASAPAIKGMADESLRLRLGQFNKAIEDIAGRHGVPLVDLYKLNGEVIRSRPEFFSSDGLHPSNLGYARWAEAMWAVVEPIIQEQSPY
jgi:lysophospholipase L1-like esterase